LTFRERALDDECFFVRINTEFDKHNGALTKGALLTHNFFWHTPPQFRDDLDISAAFQQFQLLLTAILTDHIRDFKNRLAAKDKVHDQNSS
jgi:hypothetical protein